MSERLSETPTDDELRDYLMANVKMSAVAWHFEDSEFSTGHIDPDFLHSLQSLPKIGGDRFIEKVINALLVGLRRLNELPRDDPFWGESNRRPTLYKLRDFNARLRAKDPNDTAALWAQAAMLIVHGSTNFGQTQWRRLHYAGHFDVTWPIHAALITELNASPTDTDLAELLQRLEVVEEAKVFLGTLDASEDAWIVDWRDRVLEALNP